MKKETEPILVPILRKIAKKIGAKIVVEPNWKVVGQIVFKNRRKRYFRYSSLDLNPLAASEISKDKDYASFFMKKLGYRTIPGQAFFSDNWSQTIGSNRNIDMAYRYALKIGFPVIVKPNSGSQGVGVAKVFDKREFYAAMKFIFLRDRVALVQKVITGQDYRIVVLDNKIISAYERIPLSIVGDGKSTIQALLKKKQKQFINFGRDTRIRIHDFRILWNLQRRKLSMKSILPTGKLLYLLDNANLSTGGDSVDVTEIIGPGFRKLAINLTQDMGLRLCGVDILVNGDISQRPNKYWVLETNAAPGLDHYVKIGRDQEKIVEDMYTKVLKAMQ